jgi:phospholipid transport system substrate-binding protein
MRLSRLLTVALVLGYLFAPLPAAEAESGTEVIENLNETLLAVMQKADELGYTGRYQRFAPMVTTSYDMPFISRIVVGRYWREFSDEQRTRFVEAFTDLTIATYAGRFNGYSGERFSLAPEEKLPKGRLRVTSLIVEANGEEVRLDYIMHQKDKQWRIINVIANGVSDLSLKRADYTTFLKNKGYDALLAKLNEKIAQYEE